MVFSSKVEKNPKRFTTTTTTAAAASMQSIGTELKISNDSTKQSTATMNKVFECKTCSKEFSSFQALGGHRASHKKLRLIKGDESNMDGKLSSSKSSSLHECSICGKGYAIGQALGGHMRRHRNPSKKSPSLSPPPSEELFSLPLLPHAPLAEEQQLSLPLLPHTPLAEEQQWSLPLFPQTPLSEETKTFKRKLYSVNRDKGLCLDLSLGPPSSGNYQEELDSDDHHQSMPTSSGNYQEELDSDDHHQSMPTKPYLGVTLLT